MCLCHGYTRKAGKTCNRRVPPRTWAGRESQMPENVSKITRPSTNPQQTPQNCLHNAKPPTMVEAFLCNVFKDWSPAALYLRHGSAF